MVWVSGVGWVDGFGIGWEGWIGVTNGWIDEPASVRVSEHVEASDRVSVSE